ncbi:MAG: dienelactone hydrolase family protein [Chthoniobacterales bacterium]|nr:dienelactone hydrolase family protein [Chthoniobacterales bacterium]
MKKFLFLAIAFLFIDRMEAKLITKSVAYEDRGTKLQGYVAYDDEKTATGKVPGILVVPEWWGVNAYVKNRADQLAQLGYVAFVADMYGDGKSTEDPKQAGEWAGPFEGKPRMAERAQAGLDQLQKILSVDQTKLAAIGFCFGGSTVQALAYTGAPLAGIASFHGGPVPAPASAAGKVKAKFLLMNGAIDKMVPPEKRNELEKSLEAAGIDYQSIDYAGALHAFTNPNADRVAREHGMTGMIAYNEPAARRSWAQMQTFFQEIFAGR